MDLFLFFQNPKLKIWICFNRIIITFFFRCAVDDPLPGGSRVIYENFESNYFRFSFTSFHWTFPLNISAQELNIICVVSICDQSWPEFCAPAVSL